MAVATVYTNLGDEAVAHALNETQVKEVYGGEGKVKVKKKNKNKVFSFKYTGPERAAKLLEGGQKKRCK